MDYIDLNGKRIKGENGQEKLLKQLYGTEAGRMALKVLTMRCVSEVAGKLLDSRFSSFLIDGFAKRNHIDRREYEQRKYCSFNDFFTRKIRTGKRPVACTGSAGGGLVSPSDGKVTVYPVTQDLEVKVKGRTYTLESLLKNQTVASHFRGGYVYIVRLCVEDYHRYIYPVSGMKTKNYHINGVYHTVNPIAGEYYPIYKENTREYTLIRAENKGYVLQMEVGALLVGRIVNHHQSRKVRCGEEKGYFEYGGSTIVVITDQNMAPPRQELLRNTAEGCETKILQGQLLTEK